MAATIRAHELTSKQAHRIVTELLRTADPAARDEVLADPLRYLSAIDSGSASLAGWARRTLNRRAGASGAGSNSGRAVRDVRSVRIGGTSP